MLRDDLNKTYTVSTIKDIFEILTPENVDAFCKDFELTMKMAVLNRATAIELAKQDGYELDPKLLVMHHIHWIDDGKNSVSLEITKKEPIVGTQLS